jgi:hypothetical protein
MSSPSTVRAATLAGALRTRVPIPPPAGSQRQRRSKADNRVAWIMDIQTAATVYVHGYDLATANAHHPLIAQQVAALAPSAAAPSILTPPRF